MVTYPASPFIWRVKATSSSWSAGYRACLPMVRTGCRNDDEWTSPPRQVSSRLTNSAVAVQFAVALLSPNPCNVNCLIIPDFQRKEILDMGNSFRIRIIIDLLYFCESVADGSGAIFEVTLSRDPPPF